MRELLRPQLQRRGAYCNHVSIALGSQAELETQIEVALRQKYMTPASASRWYSGQRKLARCCTD